MFTLPLKPIQGQDIPGLSYVDFTVDFAALSQEISADAAMARWFQGDWVVARITTQGSSAPGMGIRVGRKAHDIPEYHESYVVLRGAHTSTELYTQTYADFRFSTDMLDDRFIFKLPADFFAVSKASLSLHFEYAKSPEEDIFLQEMHLKQRAALSPEEHGFYRRCIESLRDGRLHQFIADGDVYGQHSNIEKDIYPRCRALFEKRV